MTTHPPTGQVMRNVTYMHGVPVLSFWVSRGWLVRPEQRTRRRNRVPVETSPNQSPARPHRPNATAAHEFFKLELRTVRREPRELTGFGLFCRRHSQAQAPLRASSVPESAPRVGTSRITCVLEYPADSRRCDKEVPCPACVRPRTSNHMRYDLCRWTSRSGQPPMQCSGQRRGRPCERNLTLYQ